MRVVTGVTESSSFFVHQKTIGAGNFFGNTVTTFQKLVTSRGIGEVAVRVRAVGWQEEPTNYELKKKKLWLNRCKIPWAQARKANVITSCNAAISFRMSTLRCCSLVSLPHTGAELCSQTDVDCSFSKVFKNKKREKRKVCYFEGTMTFSKEVRMYEVWRRETNGEGAFHNWPQTEISSV